MGLKVDTLVVVSGMSYGSLRYTTEEMSGEIKLSAEDVASIATLAYKILEARHQSIKDAVQVIANPMLAAPVELVPVPKAPKYTPFTEVDVDVPF